MSTTHDMSSQPHLQIFNPGRISHFQDSSFSLFPFLPKEIRLSIWQHSLQRQRIIKLYLKDPKLQAAIHVTENARCFGINEGYCAVVNGYQVLSKLLRVSSESREAALKFYRIHIPCRLLNELERDETTSSGTLYFNPEYDSLYVKPESPVQETLASFLYHLKTIRDPRRIGLLNLAVDLNSLNANDLYKLQSSELDPGVRTAFVETLTQLQEVFFVSTPRAGRQILGYLSGIPTSDTIFNRSLPIMAMTPTFDRLPRDSRPIAQDLRQVFVGTSDPRHMLLLWRRLLERWGISPLQIRYRFLLGFEQMLGCHQIQDRESAQKWVQKEDDDWRGVIRLAETGDDRDREQAEKASSSFIMKNGIKWPIGALSERYRNEDLEKAVRPAFGFWLFPVEALGALPEKGSSEEDGFQPKPKQLLDMTEHWPELALSNLP